MKTLLGIILLSAANVFAAKTVILNCRISKIMDVQALNRNVATQGTASQVSVIKENGILTVKLGYYATYSSNIPKEIVTHYDISDKDLVYLSKFRSDEMIVLSVFKATNNRMRSGRVVMQRGAVERIVAYLQCQ